MQENKMINQKQRRQGQVAIITGGAGDLGAAIARRFVGSGIKSALWDIDIAKAERIAAEIPGAAAYLVDVTDYGVVEAATRQVVEDFGRIDILVNSAGINGPISGLDHRFGHSVIAA
jgi:NAD(P)-dependent dehydrogenase (short-subunit alcohol dehydrogenase family)